MVLPLLQLFHSMFQEWSPIFQSHGSATASGSSTQCPVSYSPNGRTLLRGPAFQTHCRALAYPSCGTVRDAEEGNTGRNFILGMNRFYCKDFKIRSTQLETTRLNVRKKVVIHMFMQLFVSHCGASRREETLPGFCHQRRADL